MNERVAHDPVGSGATGDAPVRVLVVDDSAACRFLIEALLKKLGMECQSAGTGGEAVEKIASGARPDLVLMDCQMPGMDGYEATRAIREWELDRGMPRLTVIALTGSASQDDFRQCIAAGMDDLLPKPVDMRTLSDALSNWLARGTRRPVDSCFGSPRPPATASAG